MALKLCKALNLDMYSYRSLFSAIADNSHNSACPFFRNLQRRLSNRAW